MKFGNKLKIYKINKIQLKFIQRAVFHVIHRYIRDRKYVFSPSLLVTRKNY